MLSRPCLGPPPDPGGRNIAYDLALVKLGPHTKFGEDWSNSVDFYTGHTHKHTHTDSVLYIRLQQILFKWKLFTKDNSGTGLIKHGSLMESSSLR
jgi:hypothetical protein